MKKDSFSQMLGKNSIIGSIVNWDYQDNFKPVYFFFYKKISRAQKAPKRRTCIIL